MATVILMFGSLAGLAMALVAMAVLGLALMQALGLWIVSGLFVAMSLMIWRWTLMRGDDGEMDKAVGSASH